MLQDILKLLPGPQHVAVSTTYTNFLMSTSRSQLIYHPINRTDIITLCSVFGCLDMLFEPLLPCSPAGAAQCTAASMKSSVQAPGYDDAS